MNSFANVMRLTVCVILTSAFACSAATADSERLTRFPESTWLASDADIAAQLQSQPAECLDPDAYAEQPLLIDLGRAAFRTPALLGGQAARMGLSCDSCHRNGHDNPAFFIAGLSDSPGTLDVTHGFFSEVRDDGIFNPVAIPDLLDLDSRDRFGTIHSSTDLGDFVHSVIVDEFAGLPPPPLVMDALLAYQKSLNTQACMMPDTIARDLQSDLQLLNSFIDTLLSLLEAGSSAEVTSFMVQAVQTQMHQIYLRFSTGSHQEIVEQTTQLSRALRTIVETSHLQTLRLQNVDAWQIQLTELQQRMLARQRDSYYHL